MQMKIESTPEKLCEGYPGILFNKLEPMNRYFQYCRNLQFEEKPDYNYLKELLKSIDSRKNQCYEINLFDWAMINV